MSGQAVTWVIEHSAQHGGPFTVLMVMASHAHPDGGGIRVGMAALAREARLSERQVRRIIRELELSGELACCMNGGRGNPNIYTITGMEKGDTMMSPISEPNTDIRVSPNGHGDDVQRGTLTLVKGDISGTKGDISDVKGDIHARAGINPKKPKETRETLKPAHPRERAREPTRLAETFVISERNYEWASGAGLSEMDIHAATLEFCDYWRGVPGVKGKKLDWDGTWRNSVRMWARKNRRVLKEIPA